MTETLEAAPRPTASIADPTIGFRRIGGAIALPLAFACQLVCNALYAQASMSGVSDTGTGAETLEFYRTFAGQAQIMTVFALVGCLLAVPGLLAALRVLRPRKPRLALWAVGFMIAGYVCYFGIVSVNFVTIALAAAHADAGAAIDAAQAMPGALAVFLVFAIGNLVGTLLLGLAAILSRDTPWWVGALIIGWPVGHVVNLVGGGEWFAVAGGALEVVGFGFLAAIAVRTSNAVWGARG
jgi:hypothetical protein